MWLLPAIVVPLAVGVAVIQWLMDRRPEARLPHSWAPLAMVRRDDRCDGGDLLRSDSALHPLSQDLS
jgi:hypothetical protein